MKNSQMEANLSQVYSTELIEKLDAKSAKRLWRALVIKDNENYYTQQEFWSIKQDGTESKHTFSALTKVEKKNVGKSNETSEEEQAIKEAIALYNKKLDGVLNEDNFLPMLALTYNSKKVSYPAYQQPKYDGCFHYNTKIKTKKGLLKIGDIVTNKLQVEVLSYNEASDTFEFKPIVNWFDNGSSSHKEWLEISLGNKIFTKVTKQHKFYTERGWVVADELNEKTDRLLVNILSDYQITLLAGTLLGDTCISIDKRCPSKSYRLIFNHTNKELFDFKVAILGLEGTIIEYTTGYGSKGWRFTSTALTYSTFPIDIFFDLENDNPGKRILINYKDLKKVISKESLSLWIADDGCLSFNNGNKETPRLTLNTHRYSKEQLMEFITFFEKEYGCTPSVYKDSRIQDENSANSNLTFNTKDTIYLLSFLRKYQCKGVEYKYFFNTEGYLPTVEDKFKWTTFKKRNAKYHKGNLQKFDIEVADNHNYIANNIVVHNCRCTVKPDKSFWTRKGKQIAPNIVEHIAAALPETDYILDGELILPKEYTFQETVSAVKKYNSHTSLLGLYVYDVYTTDTYEDRYSYLQSLNLQAPLHLCPTEKVHSEEEFINKSLLLIEAGFEGSMYRSKSGLYKPNVRSADLLKYKIAEDAEYTIVNVLEGKGKELGCAIFECQSGDKTFTVRPVGTEEYRKQLWADRNKLIGLPLTVKYNGLTDENLPRFPVGKAVRSYE